MFARFGLFLVVCSVTRGLLSLGVQTPPRFDIEDIYFDLSEVGSIERVSSTPCKVTGAYALATALEIANFIASGESTQFSVQEIVDCHFGGCNERRISEYAEWLAVNDRLAPVDKYTNYKSTGYVCRASTSPDALTNIKVLGSRAIDVAEFESEMTLQGSVMACMDTSQTNCWAHSRYQEGIIDGESSEFCGEKVLIVGYTETYYRVRGSKGPNWGENGYFRILRGGNKCGIEHNMVVLVTEPRRNKPGVDPVSGCPANFPKYCSAIKTCRTNSQFCMTATKSKNRGKRSTPALDQCTDHPGYPCRALSRHCAHKTIWEKCGGTCGMCKADGTPKCSDTEDFPGECASYKRYCRMVPALKLKCQLTCEVPPGECSDNKRTTPGIVKMDPPPVGTCYPPEIQNGRILNRRVFLKPKEKLQVRCNAGYHLQGESVYCEIQNVFRPDSRRLPVCVKLGDENFVGNGADYQGARNFTTSGRSCDNWLKAAHRGTFRTVERGLLLLSGENHNYCRNVVGEPAPFCFSRSGQMMEYCFSLPKCGGDENDECSAPRVDIYDCMERYSPADCIFTNELAKNQKKWIWDHCGAMCCSYARCQ
ncbi:uncharacterized protein LOC134811855 [Bolinopsis microptera]|uniref:uncharacterized protein LOC134811855 n=1 Tax=Bolinopsis microptera TaxID=2820187 RepID=UPI00307AC6B3